MTRNPFDSGYFESEELRSMGFGSIGDSVKIAKNCTIVGLRNVHIGSNVRIDGYTTILAEGGEVTIGSNIHIAGYCYVAASEKVTLKDFAGLSQGVRVYTRSDNYDGSTLTNPTIPMEYTRPNRGEVIVGRHVIVGTGTVVLPKVNIEDGCAIGALSLVNRSTRPWGIYSGVPAKRKRDRKKGLLEFEERFIRGGSFGEHSNP